MNNKKIYWSDEEFKHIVLSSSSITQVLNYFGLPVTQPHYRKRFYFDIKRLKLNINYGTKQIIENDGKAIKANTKTKKNLIKKGLLKEYCYICGLNFWLNKKLNLHLDHIDGNRNNNNLENLRLLCPNCHSQTDTYCNKNVKNKWKPDINPKNKCINCGKYRGWCKKPGFCMICYKNRSN